MQGLQHYPPRSSSSFVAMMTLSHFFGVDMHFLLAVEAYLSLNAVIPPPCILTCTCQEGMWFGAKCMVHCAVGPSFTPLRYPPSLQKATSPNGLLTCAKNELNCEYPNSLDLAKLQQCEHISPQQGYLGSLIRSPYHDRFYRDQTGAVDTMDCN